jgi:uncharacterized protein (TIGR02246 family)
MRFRFAFGLLALAITSASANVRTDISAINRLEQRQADAWNAHDINAYSDIFVAEAHVVNVLGWHWTSRAELNQKLGRAFASVFAKSRMTIEETTVDLLKPDIAVAHVRWTMAGALDPTGSGGAAPQRGIQTQVLVKRAGAWKIIDLQNTNSVPEVPFPAPR